MTSKLKNDIMQCCKEINQKCQIEFEEFCFNHLQIKQWYLTILGILFPHLQDKIQHINQISDQTTAINDIVILINQLDQFQTLQIDGKKIVNGDVNEIANMVQVILTLLQITLEQYEEGDEMQNKQKENKMIQNEKKPKQKKSLSDYNKPKSVQAIGNQFQKSEEEEDYQHFPFNNMQLKQSNNPTQKQNKINQEGTNQNQQQQTKEKLNGQNNQDNHNQSTQKPTSSKKNTKYPKHKNLQRAKLLGKVKKTKKQLVTHPKSPQTLKKAVSEQAIQLTKKISQDIKKTKKKINKFIAPNQLFSPTHQEIKRKIKQHNLLLKQQQHNKKQQQATKSKKKNFALKNNQNLQKILNWRDERIKKQRKQYELSMKMKLQNQRERYIKKINNLIFELQKQKQIQAKKDFKQTLTKDNEQALKRLTALQQWYKNKLDLIKQNRNIKKQQRFMIKTGHKQIISQIQKYLKSENQYQLIKLTQKFRNQHQHIENDFDQLKDKIIKTYKKY